MELAISSAAVSAGQVCPAFAWDVPRGTNSQPVLCDTFACQHEAAPAQFRTFHKTSAASSQRQCSSCSCRGEKKICSRARQSRHTLLLLAHDFVKHNISTRNAVLLLVLVVLSTGASMADVAARNADDDGSVAAVAVANAHAAQWTDRAGPHRPNSDSSDADPTGPTGPTGSAANAPVAPSPQHAQAEHSHLFRPFFRSPTSYASTAVERPPAAAHRLAESLRLASASDWVRGHWQLLRRPEWFVILPQYRQALLFVYSLLFFALVARFTATTSSTTSTQPLDPHAPTASAARSRPSHGQRGGARDAYSYASPSSGGSSRAGTHGHGHGDPVRGSAVRPPTESSSSSGASGSFVSVWFVPVDLLFIAFAVLANLPAAFRGVRPAAAAAAAAGAGVR